MAYAFSSCHERTRPYAITQDSLAVLRTDAYVLSAEAIRGELKHLAYADKGADAADRHTRNYYLENGRPLWVSRLGVVTGADSVLKYVAEVSDWGFSRDRFGYDDIRRDLQRVRNLDFSSPDDDINTVYARLEYRLTKAYLRYCAGQRFGYVNPYDIYNRIEVRDSDSVRVTYNALFDIPMRRADKSFFAVALRKVMADSVGAYMRESYPSGPLYGKLRQRLAEPLTPSQRVTVLCNMERCRWQTDDNPWRHRKYVLVNLAAQQLEAVDGDDTLTMRIGCGAQDTKTPLLTSRIKRIDVNPQWVIPRSIIKKSVVRHAGDVQYFARHNYIVRDRKTGREISPAEVSQDMLMDKNILVVQRGGAGNALGRIIFRFDNNFSVYLHDTSSPDVFSRQDRSVSHGCVRVEKPFDLAVFLLADKDEDLIDRLRYSMTYSDDDGDDGPASAEQARDRKRLLRSLPVSPQIPLFITYYTLYPDAQGRMRAYPDVYGYDQLLYQKLKTYL